ncbi:hypothetical protein AMTRI_Chr02g223420 [Amborella trichopoda]
MLTITLDRMVFSTLESLLHQVQSFSVVFLYWFHEFS